DRIRNIHIHDNLGKSDDHMTIGDGSIDFKKVLSLLHSYKHRYIIESKTFDSAVTSQERLRELLGAQ
ncbi:MAG: sugar phosphate isomerase/epimerase, partial [archaeon]|nr:sugar phosphate isomerase/epimerase [archaeon]